MKDWAWPLLVVVLFLLGVVLIALRLFGLIDWPWWAALVPVYLLVALIGWAIVGLDQCMREAASPDAPDAWFEYTDNAHIDHH